MFKHIVANAAEGIVIIEKQLITYYNQAFLRLLNAEGKDVQIENKDIISLIKKDSRAKFIDELKQLEHQEKVSHFNIQFLTFDDSKIYTEAYLSKINYENNEHILLSVRPSEKYKVIQSDLGKALKKKEDLKNSFNQQSELLKANELILKENINNLNQSEERYKSLIDSIPVGVIVHVHYKIVFINQSGINILKGENEGDFVGKNILDFIKPKRKKDVKKRISDLYKKKEKTTSLQEQFINTYNELLNVEVKEIPIDFSGDPAVQISFIDITNHIQIEQTLNAIYNVTLNHTGTNLYKQAVAGLADIFNAEITLIGRLFYGTNYAIHSLALYEGGEIQANIEFDIKNTPFESLVGNDEVFYTEKVTSAFPLDHWLKEKNIESFIGTCIKDSNDNAIAVIAVLDRKKLKINPLLQRTLGIIAKRVSSEIERMEAEKRLRHSRRDYRALFKHAHEAIIIFEPETEIILDVNPKACELYGLDRNDLLGAPLKSISTEIAKGKVYLNHILNKGELSEVIITHRHKDGALMFLEVNAGLIPYQGKIAISSTYKNISEKILAEKALKASKKKYKSLYHKTPVMLHTIDSALNLSSMSDLWLKKLGYKYNEVIGKPSTDFLTKEYKNILLQKVYPELIKKKQVENVYAQYLRKDGSVMDVLISAIADVNATGKLIQIHSVITDITDKKRAEEALKDTMKTATNLQYAMDTASIIATISLENNILYVNDQFCQVSKYSRNELIGKSYSMLYSGFHPNAMLDELWEEILSGKIVNGEYKYKAKDGSYYWLDTTIVPFMGIDNKPEHFIEISYDITQKKENEKALETYNLELEKTNIELDKFVYSVSHQLRSPLTSVLGLLDIAEQDTDDPKQNNYISLMKKSIHKLDETIHEINDYSRNARLELQYEKINFRELINNILESYQYLEGAKDMQVSIQIKNEDTPFYTDKARLKVALNNLISNAIKYFDPRKEFLEIDIKIEIAHQTIFSVTDNGIGIPQERIHKIFDMFYRGTTNASGSGLGLYILKETLSKIKGEITVQSDIRLGSNFTLKLHNFANQQKTNTPR